MKTTKIERDHWQMATPEMLQGTSKLVLQNIIVSLCDDIDEQSRVPEDRERLARVGSLEIYANGVEALEKRVKGEEWLKALALAIREAAALIRLPTSAEVEEMLARLDRAAKAWAEYGFPLSLLDDLATLLRRLSPATGSPSGAEEMRERAAQVVEGQSSVYAWTADSFATMPARDRRDEDDYDRMSSNAKRESEALSRLASAIRALPVEPETKGGWNCQYDGDASIEEIRSEIGRLQSILHDRALGDPRVGVGPPADLSAQETKT